MTKAQTSQWIERNKLRLTAAATALALFLVGRPQATALIDLPPIPASTRDSRDTAGAKDRLTLAQKPPVPPPLPPPATLPPPPPPPLPPLPPLTVRPMLNGIVSLHEAGGKALDAALLVLTEHEPGRAPVVNHRLLQVGERDGDFEVVAIEPKEGRVVLSRGVEKIELKLDGAELGNTNPVVMQFRGTDLPLVIDVYQRLAKRTVVHPISIDAQKLSLTIGTATEKQAAAALEEAFVTNGLALDLRGDKFALLARRDEPNVLAEIANPLRSDRTASSATNDAMAAIFPPGLIKFQAADLLQVLDVHQDLTGRTIIQPTSLVRGKISVRSETSLTRAEVIWLMEACLRMAGVAIIPEAEKFLFALPPNRTGELPHFDRKAPSAKIAKPLPAGLIKLQNANADQLVEIYQKISGRELEPSGANVPPAPWRSLRFNVRSQTELDAAEASYLIEALAHVNGIKFEMIGPNQFRLVPLLEN